MLSKEVNVGMKERKIRFAAGSFLLLASVFMGNIPVLVLGAILVGTGFTRSCPIYAGLGRSSVDPNDPAESCGCGHGHGH
jgi:hypothetical protein